MILNFVITWIEVLKLSWFRQLCRRLYLIDTLLVLLRLTRTVLFCVCKVSLQSFDIMPPKSLLSIIIIIITWKREGWIELLGFEDWLTNMVRVSAHKVSNESKWDIARKGPTKDRNSFFLPYCKSHLLKFAVLCILTDEELPRPSLNLLWAFFFLADLNNSRDLASLESAFDDSCGWLLWLLWSPPMPLPESTSWGTLKNLMQIHSTLAS